MNDVSGRSYSVLGLARTGVAAARWLALHGADVLASDAKEAGALRLDGLPAGVEVVTGRNVVREGDTVVISPGIPPGSPTFKEAHGKGAEVVSDIELFWRHAPCPVVAVTGTDGKSTTTALVGELVKASGRCVFVGGNIGCACMEGLDELTRDSVAVLEVSCFQLMHCPTFSPAVAVVTNIAEDHVEYHGSFEAYVATKRRVYANMGPGQRLVVNGDDAEIERWTFPTGVEVRRFGWSDRFDPWSDGEAVFVGGVPVVRLEELRLAGLHNVENVMAALGAVEGRLSGMEPLVPVLREFAGLEHRMEYVASVGGVTFYNDSKATNPHAAMAVLRAFPDRFWLLAGGYEKGSDLSEFGRLVGERTLGAVLYGACRRRMAEAIPAGHPVHEVEDLARAVDLSLRLARPGEKVILVPGTSSFDQFDDFEHRGRVFKELVRELATCERGS